MNINIGGCFLKFPNIEFVAWKNSDTLKYLLPILLIGLNNKLVTQSLMGLQMKAAGNNT
jgi:hypothetical protein